MAGSRSNPTIRDPDLDPSKKERGSGSNLCEVPGYRSGSKKGPGGEMKILVFVKKDIEKKIDGYR